MRRLAPLALVSLVPLASLAGCSCGDSHTSADAASGADAPGLDAPSQLDASSQLDAPSIVDAPGADTPPPTVDAAGLCLRHSIVEVPIQEITLLESLPVHAGRSFRVAARYTMPDGCHSRAMPRVERDPATHTVHLLVRDWVVDGMGCPELAREDTRIFTFQLEAADWTFVDASTGGTASLTMTVGPGIRAACVPDGGDCQQNCDCLDGDQCISGVGLAGPFLQCATPCEEDVDCAQSGGGVCSSIPDGLASTCERTSSACSAPGHACGEGRTCEGPSCVPAFSLSASTRHACTCDGDCDPGLSCVTGATGAQCEVPCLTQTEWWCGSMHFCGEQRQDVSGLAVSDGV
ncbi:MAG: hypothetical protein K1X94_12865, partial [Sandaracinaceae bacterium]|nr:hypothetical protein [Sandaracinaceae bacterium]